EPRQVPLHLELLVAETRPLRTPRGPSDPAHVLPPGSVPGAPDDGLLRRGGRRASGHGPWGDVLIQRGAPRVVPHRRGHCIPTGYYGDVGRPWVPPGFAPALTPPEVPRAHRPCRRRRRSDHLPVPLLRVSGCLEPVAAASSGHRRDKGLREPGALLHAHPVQR